MCLSLHHKSTQTHNTSHQRHAIQFIMLHLHNFNISSAFTVTIRAIHHPYICPVYINEAFSHQSNQQQTRAHIHMRKSRGKIPLEAHGGQNARLTLCQQTPWATTDRKPSWPARKSKTCLLPSQRAQYQDLCPLHARSYRSGGHTDDVDLVLIWAQLSDTHFNCHTPAKNILHAEHQGGV